MPFSLPESFDVLEEGLLGEDFLQACWPTALPEGQVPPSPRDLAVLDEMLQDDVAVRALDVDARRAVRAAALAIERRVPFLTSTGRALPSPHRLFLAAETAKALRGHPRDDLAMLASVVVYPGVTKLRRGHDELGALLMRGPHRLLPVLAELEDGARLLLEVAVHGGGVLKPLRRALQKLVDEGQAWRAKIVPGHALPDDREALVRFATRGREVWADSLRQLGRDASLAQAIATAGIDLGPLIERRVVACEHLGALSEALSVPSQASIHIGWATQLACHTTTGHDPLIHELAHLVDFAHGGIDGVPTTAVAAEWRAAWDEQEQGAHAFLDGQARRNPAELLAVATEMFFTDVDVVRRSSPGLARLLEQTWGQVPVPRARRSSFWVARRLLFSRYGGHFD